MAQDRPRSVSKRSGEVSAVGLRVLEVLEIHTRFPWPLLKAQCQQRGLDPVALDEGAIRDMLDDLIGALAQLTDGPTAARARAEIEATLRG